MGSKKVGASCDYHNLHCGRRRARRLCHGVADHYVLFGRSALKGLVDFDPVGGVCPMAGVAFFDRLVNSDGHH